jgi:hypothetical protein
LSVFFPLIRAIEQIMFRKELIILGCLALLVFLIVTSFASWVVHAVQRDGKMLAGDTLPGLVNAGDAINRLNENWFDAHVLLTLESAEARSSLMQKITDNSTLLPWQRYSASIYDQRDQDLFTQMQLNRDTYLAERTQYFHLIDAGNLPAAREFFQSHVKPAFEKYRDSANSIFAFNAKVGQQRADRVIRFSWWTPYALAGFCVLVLLAGVFVGFKASLGAFSGAWTENIGTQQSNRSNEG